MGLYNTCTTQNTCDSLPTLTVNAHITDICDIVSALQSNLLSTIVFQVAGAYSKTWSYREDAILTVYTKLLELSPATPREELRNMIRAAVFLVKKALLDKVSSVSLFLKKILWVWMYEW